MADGNLITAFYQFQLHDTLYSGKGNGVSIEYGSSIEGLGVPDAKTQDVVKNFGDGSFGNPDYVSVRVITIPTIIRGTASGAMTALKNATQDWAPLTADTDLAFKLPGWGLFEVHGRPRGIKADLSRMKEGIVRALFRFDCLDPTITYL